MESPITYTNVVRSFPDLPPLTGAWRSHPLCTIFGDLDIEDDRNKRPFRTALVFAKETGRPGEGFFEMIESQTDKVWTNELKALIDHYA